MQRHDLRLRPCPDGFSERRRRPASQLAFSGTDSRTPADDFRAFAESLRGSATSTTSEGAPVRFLLTSAGIKNSSINDAMLDLLGKPIAECDALCIPTASYGHAPGGIRGSYRFITGQATTPMCELGWKSLGILELTALPTVDRKLWVPVVEEIDVLLVNGGDSLYLAHHMRESGLADLLPSLSGGGGGLSAGSMVMAPRIGEDFKVWNPPDGGDSALGIVDFSIFPHVDHPALPENTMDEAERWAAGLGNPAYAIDDDTAIKVTDAGVEVISEGHWRQFTPTLEESESR